MLPSPHSMRTSSPPIILSCQRLMQSYRMTIIVWSTLILLTLTIIVTFLAPNWIPMSEWQPNMRKQPMKIQSETGDTLSRNKLWWDLPDAKEPRIRLDYCLIYSADLSTPHGRCFNFTKEQKEPIFQQWIQFLRERKKAGALGWRRRLLQEEDLGHELNQTDANVDQEVLVGDDEEATNSTPNEDDEDEEEQEAEESIPVKPDTQEESDIKEFEKYVRSLSSATDARYPCIPIQLTLDDHLAIGRELGTTDQEQLSTILVIRGDSSMTQTPSPSSSSSSSSSSSNSNISELALQRLFLQQYQQLMTPKTIFPDDIDPNRPFKSQLEQQQPLTSNHIPLYSTNVPAIESKDLLLFHDRLSWTLFVQDIDSCPLNSSVYDDDYIKHGDTSADTTSCLPHHEQIFGRMSYRPQTQSQQLAENSDPSSSPRPPRAKYFQPQCSSCDGHARADYLLVPRALFHSTVSALACKSSVHSLLDFYLEIQDHNEQRAAHEELILRLKERRSSSSSSTILSEVGSLVLGTYPPRRAIHNPFVDPSHWNRVGPDGETQYLNSDKESWVIDSSLELVEPSTYISQEKIDHYDQHRDYPNLTLHDHQESVQPQYQFNQHIHLMCCTRTRDLRLPPRPPLPSASPVFHHQHHDFPPPSPDYLSPSTVTEFNPKNLTTFLQPQRNMRYRGSWRADAFQGWVDLQGQGRYFCPKCVLRWDFCRYLSGKEMPNVNKTSWKQSEYFACALAGDKEQYEFTERGRYLEEGGYIARVDPTAYTALEVRGAITRRQIRRVVYSDRHVSWYGCTTSSPLCCQIRHPMYPLGCRALRKDSLWVSQAPCCRKHFIRLYHYLVTLFEQHKVEWALGFGTLLTALRSNGQANPYDYDADIIVYYKGYMQIKALIPQMERDGYVVLPNWKSTCKKDCELYRILYQSPDHLHQTTIDIFIQNEEDKAIHPFNETTTFLHRLARIPHNSVLYLDSRYRGWREDQIFTVENWRVDPKTGKSPPWLWSSFLKVKRPFNRSMELVTLPPWAKHLHAFGEYDLSLGGIDRRDERAPTITIVWRPEQMKD